MIYELIKKTLEEQLGIDSDLISPSALIEKDLELDSTETVAIALEIKKKMGVDFKFPPQDLSLQQICEQIESMQAEKV